ncbi:hypothetical protein EF879_12365 [Micromonospora sp. HM5-17]|nr:hypothetical protein EF879_12365 [Micromonospora sp. HM5-17]
MRLRPVPPLDPPFDDEYASEIWIGGPTSTELDGLRVRADEAAVRPARRGMTPVGGPAGASVVATTRAGAAAPETGHRVRPDRTVLPSRPGPCPSAPADETSPAAVLGVIGPSPEAGRVARFFLCGCLEIVNGRRPAGHIRAQCDPAVARGVMHKLVAAAARISVRCPGQPAPIARLQRLRVCEPRPGIIEAAAVINVADRTWAMAFRIERRRGRWVGVSVEVII